MTILKQPEITFTEAALTRIHDLITRAGNTNLKLRIYIVGGGCSGFQYGFTLDEQVNPDDIMMQKSHIPRTILIVVDVMSIQYLSGAVVDYIENLQGTRFVVQNPHAETTCGCGSSFSLKEDTDD